MTSTFTTQIDHLVILLPHSQLVSPPSWLTTHFTLSSGGVHADGRTENRLIVFQDGTYLELIAFINDDPARREGHVWGEKPFGLVDVSLTTDGDAAAHWAALAGRLDSPGAANAAALGIRYAEPVEGGRDETRRNRVELEGDLPCWYLGRHSVLLSRHDAKEPSSECQRRRSYDASEPCGDGPWLYILLSQSRSLKVPGV